jgi:hypothetical protein
MQQKIIKINSGKNPSFKENALDLKALMKLNKNTRDSKN